VSLLERLVQAERQGKPVTLATIVRAQGSVPRHVGCKMLVYADGSFEGTIGGGELESRVLEAALEALRSGRPGLVHFALNSLDSGDPGVCGGELDVYLDPILGKPTLLVIGGGHVGKAVAHLAHWLGFRVIISDDRPEFATRQAVPDADDWIPGALADLPGKVEIDSQTYVLLTTRGVPVDVDALPALLDKPAAYIGVIGSRRRWEVCAEQLRQQGVPQDQIDRVHSPVGLELHAETPEEIAVSMLAEIIMLRRGGTGEVMAHRPRAAQGE
jgi:xanthine dehydrogenase accessory factor